MLLFCPILTSATVYYKLAHKEMHKKKIQLLQYTTAT